MVDERGLVALLYRADWRELSLSGEVSGGSVPLISVVTYSRPSRPGEPFLPHPPFAPPPGSFPETDATLLVAPGKRYRIASPDGQQVRGCDGERIWEWSGELPPDTEHRLGGDLGPPFPELLAPSWLLSGYNLAIEGDATACGRAAIRVVASARGNERGKIPAPPFWGSLVVRADSVVALVDAELGILLRCESRHGERSPDVAEFRSLTVPAEADPGQFAALPGSVFSDGWWPWSFTSPFGEAGREFAKTAAGLAAAGLGTAIKYAPRRRPDPFARATEEAADPDAVLPRDDGPAPDGPPDAVALSVSDEVLHLLYRSGADEPRFTATLHEWIDAAALLEAVPGSARKTGFGGVGFLIDVLRDSALDSGTIHRVSSVRIGGWDRYRIDAAGPEQAGGPQPGHDRDSRRHQPRTDACDGQRRWQVYEDRVAESPAAPLPYEVRGLADGSWLLVAALSGGAEITVGGRRAYRVSGQDLHQNPWPLLSMLDFQSFPAVVAVDAESGRLLRLTRYAGGNPVMCYELRDIEPGGSGDFGFEPPPGLRVVREPDVEFPGQPVNPAGFVAKAAADAARSFFGSLRGARR
jgi:hypothetical protein